MTIHNLTDDLDYGFVASLISYDASTGILTWKAKPSPKASVPPGRVAGCANHGYIQICIGQRKYRAHRIAWLLHYGKWPRGEINHINGIKNDNRIANLEDVTPSENSLHAYRIGLRRADGAYNGRSIGKRRAAIGGLPL